MAFLRGTIQSLEHESRILAGNALADPTRRDLPIYLPPDHDPALEYPVLWLLAGFTGSARSWLNWTAWQESMPDRLDRLIGVGLLPPLIVAFPDCFTRLGGSQYVNSTAQGRYADYICDELVPLVDARFRTLGAPGRAVAGKSSGGIGALWLCLQRPGLFAAAASQSGDCAFELSLEPGFARAAIALEQRGGMAAFWERLQQGHSPGGSEIDLLNTLACAAAYSPPASTPWGFSLPFDPDTGSTLPDVFEHWLRFDPVQAVRGGAEGLRRLAALHLDAGARDEYHLQLGARLLSRELHRLGIAHTHEEFDGSHRNTSARWDVSLPFLFAAIPRAG